MDPRPLAHLWIVERIQAIPGSDEMAPSMAGIIADALLANIDVGLESTYADFLNDLYPETRVVLRLPAIGRGVAVRWVE